MTISLHANSVCNTSKPEYLNHKYYKDQLSCKEDLVQSRLQWPSLWLLDRVRYGCCIPPEAVSPMLA